MEIVLKLNYRDLSEEELEDLLFNLCGESRGKIYFIEKINDKCCGSPTPKDGHLYSCGGKSGILCKECSSSISNQKS